MTYNEVRFEVSTSDESIYRQLIEESEGYDKNNLARIQIEDDLVAQVGPRSTYRELSVPTEPTTLAEYLFDLSLLFGAISAIDKIRKAAEWLCGKLQGKRKVRLMIDGQDVEIDPDAIQSCIEEKLKAQ
jgi:hypothetical protein